MCSVASQPPRQAGCSRSPAMCVCVWVEGGGGVVLPGLGPLTELLAPGQTGVPQESFYDGSVALRSRPVKRGTSSLPASSERNECVYVCMCGGVCGRGRVGGGVGGGGGCATV